MLDEYGKAHHAERVQYKKVARLDGHGPLGEVIVANVIKQ
jgi:hypothetical protein